MPDRQLPQAVGGRRPVEEVAGREVETDERGLHRPEIQLPARIVGVRRDPAVGDRDGAPIAHQHRLVGADPVRVQLADPAPSRARVVDAEDAAFGLVVVLGRVDETPPRGVEAVAAEVPPGRRRESLDGPPALEVQNEGEATGAAGEDHRGPPVRGDGGAVAAAGEPNRVHRPSGGIQDRRGMARRVAASGHEGRGGSRPPPPGADGRKRQEGRRRRQREQRSAANRHRGN